MLLTEVGFEQRLSGRCVDVGYCARSLSVVQTCLTTWSKDKLKILKNVFSRLPSMSNAATSKCE